MTNEQIAEKYAYKWFDPSNGGGGLVMLIEKAITEATAEKDREIAEAKKDFTDYLIELAKSMRIDNDTTGCENPNLALAARVQLEIMRLNDWISDLQSGMFINCVYCGHRYGPKESTPVSMANILKDHISQCPKHPMSSFRTQLNEAVGLLEDALNYFSDGAHDMNKECTCCGETAYPHENINHDKGCVHTEIKSFLAKHKGAVND